MLYPDPHGAPHCQLLDNANSMLPFQYIHLLSIWTALGRTQKAGHFGFTTDCGKEPGGPSGRGMFCAVRQYVRRIECYVNQSWK